MARRGAATSRSPPKWELEGLSAAAPARSYRDKLRLFGRFVGDWDMVAWGSPRVTRRPPEKVGEVHFRWVLGGTAIQDVFGGIDPKTKRFVAAGTTLRFYDERLGAWRSTWVSPSQRVVRRFIGRKVGNEIVLQEENRGLRAERWIFTDLRRNSFRWYAVRRLRPGGSWRKVEEMLLERSS
ncbi:MAG: hypothetical protein WB788_06230 [Thermoplasmata archaeon]